MSHATRSAAKTLPASSPRRSSVRRALVTETYAATRAAGERDYLDAEDVEAIYRHVAAAMTAAPLAAAASARSSRRAAGSTSR